MSEQSIAVEASTIDTAKLRELGYTVYHRLVLGLADGIHTRKIWMLDPESRTGEDAAPKGANAITFQEYIELYEDHEGGQNR